MESLIFRAHLIFVILAFVVFCASFVMGVFFLIQESRIKHHKISLWAVRLPSLGTLYSLYYKVLTVGFVSLSLGMIMGAVVSHQRQGRFFIGDPKEIGAFITWSLYALFLNLKWQAEWTGRKGIILSLLGFVAVILTFLTLNHRSGGGFL